MSTETKESKPRKELSMSTATATATESEQVDSLHYVGPQWGLLEKNGWRVGDILEDCDPPKKGDKPFRIKLAKVTTGTNATLDENGRDEMGRDMTSGPIITSAEWPVGGGITVCSLTCRNWRKV